MQGEAGDGSLLHFFLVTSIIGLFIPVKKVVVDNTKKEGKIKTINQINNDIRLLKANIKPLFTRFY